MHLTKLANQIGKHEATDPTGQNPEKGLRYLMADSGFR